MATDLQLQILYFLFDDIIFNAWKHYVVVVKLFTGWKPLQERLKCKHICESCLPRQCKIITGY